MCLAEVYVRHAKSDEAYRAYRPDGTLLRVHRDAPEPRPGAVLFGKYLCDHTLTLAEEAT
jgi:hypothetical protein